MRTSTWVLLSLLSACGGERADEVGGEAAIEACREGFDAFTTMGDGRSGLDEVLRRCGSLHAAPACREGFGIAADVPSDMRLRVLAAGCRRGYCDAPREPPLALCDGSLEDKSEMVLATEWGELERRVIHDEHAGRADDVAEALTHIIEITTPPGEVALTPLPLPTPQPPPGPSVTLAVRREGASIVIARLDRPDETVSFVDGSSPEGNPSLLAPLLVDVDRVVIAADASMPYADVVQVIDAVRSAGVTHFAIAAEPTP